VADLAEFRRVTTIALSQNPAQILRAGERVFATCPEAHEVCEIDPGRLTVSGRIGVAGRIVSAAVTPDGSRMVLATDQPAAIRVVDVAARRVVRSVALPDTPVGLDVSNEMAAVVTAGQSVVRVSLADGKTAGATSLGWRGGLIRFRPDGKALLAGAAERSEIASIDAASGALLARMPLTFAPKHFCFTPDNGGQMFVTGASDDSLVIVSPYQSEVDQTLVAGRQPSGLAITAVDDRELLCVTDAGSGDLTIFDIDSRALAASVHIGGKPGEVLITPSGGWVLVIDGDSGDVSVVRLSAALNRNIAALGQGAKPLFTVFPTAVRPESAAIIPRAV
jgi:DNA-binding beta-propeller fold protein YncE